MISFNIKMWNKVPKSVCNSLITRYKDSVVDYYKVFVFDNTEDMYKYYDNRFKYYPEEHNYAGMCKYESRIYFNDKEHTEFVKKSRLCGYILLQRDALGGGTVSHECAHAINYYFKYRIRNCKKVFSNSEYDELFAYMLGSLVNQIYDKLYKQNMI